MTDTLDSPIYPLLLNNKVSIKDFLQESYNCMLISIFEILVQEMSDIHYKQEVKKRLLNSCNKSLTIKKIVYEKTNCKLSDEESELIYSYIYAFFTKSNIRRTYDKSFKNNILVSQNNKCNICKKSIDISSSELDHIIPWSFVGDELGIGNFQMLCVDCNRKKSKSSAYNLKMFLVNK